MSADKFFIPAFFALLLPCAGQQNLDSAFRTTGTAVVAAFEPQRKVLQTSSAVILDGRKEIAYGVVISAEGHILTKASEVLDVAAPAVTVDQTKYGSAKILMVDPTWDVALLKVEATGLVPVVYARTSEVGQGTWVVANGATTRTGRRLMAGIVSAKTREIPASGGAALGVVLKEKTKLLEIDSVNEKSGAKEAGLQSGDVILSIEGRPMKKIEDMAEVLKDRKAGTTVKLTYRRQEAEATVDVRLAAKGELFAEEPDRNDQMSGEFSPRRSGFPRILQHDILGSRAIQGGPLLDLDGRCVGMNIARANRAESFAIPVEDLKEIAARLMKQSGN
ncbi:PDZ domain-containing protein [Luteolibacter yonseiensis]|uniref:PDZ domain-containing protein n=1 Tax=Luteolibacter yonseiensis TaxID=1144680 RepID=A0A934R3V8_9BACT|nr:PDZ domain-containing protein [Luteolibacter yonseiensis]MBK1815578.1 PDZ domain-containing protein [Luteolibacter yonseiensis]